jgi:SCY1-like protein 2
MVSTLDKATLTTKLVPLLAKIKTREPAVMMATLGVHEAMGQKVDREAIATLVLPQLWAMSMGPLLNQQQFGHFMKVIKDLGGRVEREHGEHLKDARRLETSGQGHSSETGGIPWEASADGNGTEMDFETLVKGGGPAAITPSDPWEDSWGTGDALVRQPISEASLQSGTTIPFHNISIFLTKYYVSFDVRPDLSATIVSARPPITPGIR